MTFRVHPALLPIIAMSFLSAAGFGGPFAGNLKQAQNKQVGKDDFGDPLPEGAISRLGTVRWRHSNSVIEYAFFPNAKHLASLGADSTIRVWEVGSGRAILSIRGAAQAKSIAVVSEGKTIVSAHASGKLFLWDAVTGKETKVIDSQGLGASKLTNSPDGKILACLGQSTSAVLLWDTTTWKPIHRLEHSTFMTCLAFTRDGRKLAIGDIQGSVRVWDTAAGKQEREVTQFNKAVMSLAWSPNSKSILVGFPGDPVVINTSDGNAILRLRQRNVFPGSLAVAASPDGRSFAVAETGSGVDMVDAKTGEVKAILPGSRAGPPLSFSPDGRIVAAVDGPSIFLWDAKTHKALFSSEVLHENIFAAVPSPDKQFLLIQSKGLPLSLWDANTHKKVARFKERTGGVDAPFAVSPDGKHLADTELIGDIFLRRFDTGEIVKVLKSTGGARALSIAFSPNGILLAAASANRGSRIVIWDVNTAKELKTITPQNYGALNDPLPGNLAFSTDSKAIAFGCSGNVIMAYSVVTGELEWTWSLDKAESFEWSIPIPMFVAGGELLAVGGGRSVSLWNLASHGKLFHDAKCRWGFDCSRDGRLLATIGFDNSIRVWEISTGKLLTAYPAQDNPCYPCFTRDGKHLVSAGGCAVVWNLWRTTDPEGDNKLQKLGKQASAALWAQLEDADAAKAYTALAAFITRGDASVKFLQSQLSTVNANEGQRIRKLIDELGSDHFAAREAANQELQKVRRTAERSLVKRLQSNPPLELQQRIKKLLAVVPTIPISGHYLQQMRAIQVLEVIGTPSARALLKALSDGDADAWQAQQAQAACKRLGNYD